MRGMVLPACHNCKHQSKTCLRDAREHARTILRFVLLFAACLAVNVREGLDLCDNKQ